MNTPDPDELLRYIEALPEMAHYKLTQARMRKSIDAYCASLAALAQVSAAFSASATELRQAVARREREMLRGNDKHYVTLEMRPGDLFRKLAELVRQDPPVELPYQRPERRTAQWKDESKGIPRTNRKPGGR